MRGPLVVVGDSFLDRDVTGTADRLCPDAPAPVVDAESEHDRPGGAALAALLAARSRPDVVLVTALGDDAAGARVRELLTPAVRVVTVPVDGPTPEKIRIRVAGQCLLRLDRGAEPAPIGPLGRAVHELLPAAGAILVSDYGRGLTGHPEIRPLLARAAVRVPVVWDPHPRGSRPVAAVRLVTPNAGEAQRLAGVTGDDLATLVRAAAQLRRDWAATAVTVTMGARGALLMVGEPEPLVVPAPVATGPSVDTCGAGDAFAAAVVVGLAGGEVLSEAVATGVRRASAFVGAGGAAAVRAGVGEIPGAAVRTEPGPAAHGVIERVRAAGGTVVATGGCFDLLHPGHVATLQAARSLGECLIVCLNSDESVRRLKGRDRPICPEEDRARVLAAFTAVDAVVVFDEDTPERVLAELRPDIWVKGGDYAGVDVPEADLVRSWGGQAVVVPYLDGRSSTRLVTAARAGTPTPP
jgi:D-beta-D-heptose 7-phosphate kinase/D-beta-D-heptose 1-phosphate adenosyltransferase